MRIDFGPGCRVYYARRGQVVYLLLVGGDKSTQRQDLTKAKALLQNLPKE
jgi:putative addiction module killer protein